MDCAFVCSIITFNVPDTRLHVGTHIDGHYDLRLRYLTQLNNEHPIILQPGYPNFLRHHSCPSYLGEGTSTSLFSTKNHS